MSITLSNIGASCDLALRKGGSFVRTITYKTNGSTTDITGYTFASQIRTVDGVLAATMTCTITNAANGVFQIALNETQTRALTVGADYVWDLEVTISGATSELLRGTVCVVDEATK